MKKDPWYKNGLDFKCQGCGKCCFGFPGYVWIGQKEVNKIAAFLTIPKSKFLEKYTRNVKGLISLKELKAPSYECIFLKDHKCSIYEVRPFQCKSYPFWPQNLESEKTWEKDVVSFCPGANAHPIKHYSFEEIEKILEEFKETLF